MRKNAIPFFIIIFSLSFLGIFTNRSYLNNINHYLINSKEDYKASFTTVFTNNGSAICTAEDIQYVPRVCSDGTGGAIICWIDNRDTPVAIYAQRIVSNGTVLWGSNGKPICTLDDTLYYQAPEMVSDGTGGAIISFITKRSGSRDIYAQRINATGDVLWGPNGTTICSASNNQYSPQIISDNMGCFIIAWHDFRSGTSYDIYAQKIDLNGTVLWDTNGKVVTNAPYSQEYPKMISDGLGGAIIVWEDSRSFDTDIYAQKINSNGDSEWTNNGVEISTINAYVYNPYICTDGFGGAIISWEDYRSGDNYDIYAQRINSNGVLAWTYYGVGICTEEGYQTGAKICSDGAGGAIITWEDLRTLNYSDPNIYAQKVDSNGITLWTDNGSSICSEDGYQYNPHICTDGLGGAIIIWNDNRTFSSSIFTQWINTNGSVLWNLNGNPICTTVDFKVVEKIEMFELGSIFIIWEDYRNGNCDIFCQKITYDPDAIPPSRDPSDDGNNDDNNDGNNEIPFEIAFGYYILLIFLIIINLIFLGFLIRKRLRYKRYLDYSV